MTDSSRHATGFTRRTAVAVEAPVLIVEDHDDTRDMLVTLLEAHGFRVVAVDNGQRGLEQLIASRPCLVLLDLMMPVMTGWEFRAAQLSLADASLAAIPVVLLTASSQPDDAAQQLRSVDVIPKPIDFDRLMAVVQVHYSPAIAV